MRFLNIINWPIALSSFLLISVGILIIYSSSRELAFQQLIYTMIGITIFFAVSQFELSSIKNLINPLFVFMLFLLVLVLFLGIETRGSVRWIPLGVFNVQPSEFAKPALILFLAKFWSKNIPSWINIFKSLFYSAPFILLIFRQPDLGSALTIIAIWMGILISTRVSLKKLVILALIIICAIPVSWLFLHDYQKQRILSFLSPQSDPLGTGYNLIQSTIAVGSGEIFGRGLGRGTQSRLQFLPEFRTDFIFASIAEEMGFLGVVLILSIYLFLLMYCLKVAHQTHDLFSFLVVIGVTLMLLFQTIVNIGMNIGLMPITGITLPLISYGGSSLIATYFSLGMVAAIARFRKVDRDFLT